MAMDCTIDKRTARLIEAFVQGYMKEWNKWRVEYESGKTTTPPNPSTVPEAAAVAVRQATARMLEVD